MIWAVIWQQCYELMNEQAIMRSDLPLFSSEGMFLLLQSVMSSGGLVACYTNVVFNVV